MDAGLYFKVLLLYSLVRLSVFVLEVWTLLVNVQYKDCLLFTIQLFCAKVIDDIALEAHIRAQNKRQIRNTDEHIMQSNAILLKPKTM